MAKDKDVIICGICKASFRCDSFTRFMEHKLLHVDANQRVCCFLCPKWFPKRNALQIHLEQVHGIPQRPIASDTITASSSARCNPSSGLNAFESERLLANNGKLNSCLSLSTSQFHVPSDVPLSLQQRQEDTDLDGNVAVVGNDSSENSNLSVDVLTTEDPAMEFPLNTLNYYDDVCCTRLMISDQIHGRLENEATAFPSNISTPKYKKEPMFTSVNQNGNTGDGNTGNGSSGWSAVGGEKSNNDNMENDQPQTSVSEVNAEEKNPKEVNECTGEESGKDKKNIDFHFLLGTTSISGNSMKYERVEFRCMHCSFSSAWRPSLMKHMKIAHNDVLRFHEILDIQSATLSKPSGDQCELAKKYRIMKLSEHSKMTLQNKARKVKRLARAVEYQDIPGKYTCSVCNKVFSRIRYIRRHQLTHKTQRTYLCDHCGKSFKTRSTLVAHTRSHNIKFYQCPQCDFVSNLTRAIHCHRQLHPNGSVVCEICGAVYTDKSTLKKHMRVHDSSRPFSCSESNCTWRFKTESLMRAHMRSHTIEGKFLCTYCGYKFRHKHHLQRHISRIHPQELIESSSNVPLNPPSNTHVIRSSLSNPNACSISEFSEKQELCINFDNSPNNQVVLKSLLNSSSSFSQESGNQANSLTIPCVQSSTQTPERQTEYNQTDGQNVVQVLSLMNSNGQEIVISLPADISTDLLNNSIVNLETSDVIQHNNSSQICIARGSQL